MTPGQRRRLPLVAADEQLEGRAPRALEQLARTAQPGSSDHVGALAIALPLATRASSVCIPPTQTGLHRESLDLLRAWLVGSEARRSALAAPLREHRVNLFAALPAIEEATARAVEKARMQLADGPKTRLDEHADHTVTRFCRLAAHHATAAVCHCLDAVTDPSLAATVPSDVSGALAYQMAALGSARHAAFRAAAEAQADWEATRTGASKEALSLQVFHEYLGARWKAHSELQQSIQEQFIDWALSGRG